MEKQKVQTSSVKRPHVSTVCANLYVSCMENIFVKRTVQSYASILFTETGSCLCSYVFSQFYRNGRLEKKTAWLYRFSFAGKCCCIHYFLNVFVIKCFNWRSGVRLLQVARGSRSAGSSERTSANAVRHVPKPGTFCTRTNSQAV